MKKVCFNLAFYLIGIVILLINFPRQINTSDFNKFSESTTLFSIEIPKAGSLRVNSMDLCKKSSFMYGFVENKFITNISNDVWSNAPYLVGNYFTVIGTKIIEFGALFCPEILHSFSVNRQLKFLNKFLIRGKYISRIRIGGFLTFRYDVENVFLYIHNILKSLCNVHFNHLEMSQYIDGRRFTPIFYGKDDSNGSPIFINQKITSNTSINRNPRSILENKGLLNEFYGIFISGNRFFHSSNLLFGIISIAKCYTNNKYGTYSRNFRWPAYFMLMVAVIFTIIGYFIILIFGMDNGLRFVIFFPIGMIFIIIAWRLTHIALALLGC